MTRKFRMVRTAATSVVLLLAVATTACYHATIETGRRPSGERIEQPWALSFVAGLIPPPVVETAARCPNGVARVETQQSVLNVLVAIVTFNIVTPMTITVDCAAAGTAMLPSDGEGRTIDLRDGATRAELESALNAAAKRAAAENEAVYVTFSGIE